MRRSVRPPRSADGLCAAISRIEAGEADALAVAKLDRLSRSVRDLADLAERSRPKGKQKGWGPDPARH